MIKLLLLLLLNQTNLQADLGIVELFGEDEYLVGPGDTLGILLKDLSFEYVTFVDFAGKITLFAPYFSKDTIQLRPFAIKRVYNISLKELRDSLLTWYESVIKLTSVEVRILAPRRLTILVKGVTETNGPAVVQANLRLANLLSIPDFLCGYDADINIILIETPNRETLVVDLEQYYKNADLKNNPLLAKAKTVIVPEIKSGITIFGAVKGYPVKKFKTQTVQALSGNFTVTFESNVYLVPCKDSISVKNAIERAGGLKSFALVSEIYSSRKGKVSLDDYIFMGDTLYIPPFTDKVFIAGEVKNPGFAPYLPGASLDTYISYCGGFTNRAAPNKLYVIRANKKIPRKYLTNISPGDIIFVPEVKLKWFEDYLQLAQVITSLIITWLTVTRI